MPAPPRGPIRPEPVSEPEPAAAQTVFGAELDRARAYAELLITDGVGHGLLGPREAGRIWTRHLLNCAVVTELIEPEVRVVDVGSGAGLPGLALAIRRPDLRVQLLEPLLRRATFLSAAIERLELGARVEVVRGRAEEGHVVRALGRAPVVTARAVAPLDRLVAWCVPLLDVDGTLLALKGDTAADELRSHETAIQRLGIRVADVVQCGVRELATPTMVLRGRIGATRTPRAATKGRR